MEAERDGQHNIVRALAKRTLCHGGQHDRDHLHGRRLTNGTTYYYEVAAVSSAATSANSTPVSATPASMSLLVGTIIGTTGSWNNSGNTREYAMDGNLSTFFDAPSGTSNYVGWTWAPTSARSSAKSAFIPGAVMPRA